MQTSDIATGRYYLPEYGPRSVHVYRVTAKGVVIFRTNEGMGAPGQLHVKHFAEMAIRKTSR